VEQQQHVVLNNGNHSSSTEQQQQQQQQQVTISPTGAAEHASTSSSSSSRVAAVSPLSSHSDSDAEEASDKELQAEFQESNCCQDVLDIVADELPRFAPHHTVTALNRLAKLARGMNWESRREVLSESSFVRLLEKLQGQVDAGRLNAFQLSTSLYSCAALQVRIWAAAVSNDCNNRACGLHASSRRCVKACCLHPAECACTLLPCPCTTSIVTASQSCRNFTSNLPCAAFAQCRTVSCSLTACCTRNQHYLLLLFRSGSAGGAERIKCNQQRHITPAACT
jgi:hypothetical protein